MSADPNDLIAQLTGGQQIPPPAAPVLNQQSGLGGLLAKIQGGLGSVRSGLFPTDPNAAVDSKFADAQQRAAMIRLAAGIAGGKGLGQGISQGLDASSNQYQSAMENAYNNALKKKQMEVQQKGFENNLAQQAQHQSNWESEQKAQQARFDSEQKMPQYHVVEQPLPDRTIQPMLVDVKSGRTKPFGNAYKKPGAQNIPAGYELDPAKPGSLRFIPGGPADPAQKNNTLRAVPSAAAQGIIANRQELAKIDRALEALDKNPDAFGTQNYLPDAITQRLPGKSMSEGVDPRAKVADIGSLIIHDRSGAAVTASEFPRLRPFIPQATDDPKTVKTKLKNLRANVAAMQEETEALYSPEAGYKPIPGSAPAPSVAPGGGWSIRPVK